MICAFGLTVLAALSCCKGKNNVTALVAGPEHAVVALDIEYAAPICPESVCPEAFEVEGREVVCVKACKEGHVFLLLKPVCDKPCEEACGEAEPCEKKCGQPCEEAKPECCKAEKPCCPEECCGEAKPCKEGGECCDKPECCKVGGKPCCKEGKPECKKPCDKKCEKPAVPCISVKQVADLKDVEGNVVPAWKKAVKAGDVKPAHKPHHGCKGDKPECGKPCGEKPECGGKPCEKACGE